jgi:opacity protein-like surface antigen
MRCRSVLAAAPLLGALLAPAGAVAQPYADPGPGAGLLGFRARTTEAAGSAFLGGAQALTRFTGVLALELFAGYRSDTYVEGTRSLRVRQIPVQLSLIAYLTPNLRVQPYLLGGGGYYRILATIEDPDAIPPEEHYIENRLGLHAGAGIDFRVARSLSLRVEGRYVFLDIDAVTNFRQLGKSANSWQVGGGFNVWF